MPLERTVSLSGQQRPLSSVAVAVHQHTRRPAIGRARLDSSLAARHTRTASPCHRPAAAEKPLDGEAKARSNSPWTSHVGAQQSSPASLQISKALARGAMAERLAASLLPSASPSPSTRRATVAAAAAASFPFPCSARAGLRLRSRQPLLSQVRF